jgi:hypothetical protein
MSLATKQIFFQIPRSYGAKWIMYQNLLVLYTCLWWSLRLMDSWSIFLSFLFLSFCPSPNPWMVLQEDLLPMATRCQAMWLQPCSLTSPTRSPSPFSSVFYTPATTSSHTVVTVPLPGSASTLSPPFQSSSSQHRWTPLYLHVFT